jgi:nucleotide-binding universal stress UspA family protein
LKPGKHLRGARYPAGWRRVVSRPGLPARRKKRRLIPMFQHILVPTDFTEKSLHAARIARQLARLQEEAKITLLHIIETIDDAEYDEFADFYEKLRKRAVRKMQKLVESLGPEASEAQTAIVFAKRVPGIIHFVAENQVDLIVLGSHKIIPEEIPEGLGTISYKVGILSPCPVLMVK